MKKTWQLQALALYLCVGAPLATSCAKESNTLESDDADTGGKSSSAGSANKAGTTSKAGNSSSFGGTSSTGGASTGGKGGTAGNTSQGGANAGTGGGGGTAGAGGTSTIPPEVLERARAVVHYTCNATAASTNQIQMSLQIENKSTDALPMADVTIRYWLTAEATPELHQYYVHASLMSPKAQFVSDGENSHVVMSFGGGSIPANNKLSESEVQLAAANNATKFDQSNDFSFDETATTSKPNREITLYLQDKLIWGCEPSGVCSEDDTGAGGAGSGGAPPEEGGAGAGGAP